VTSAARFSRIRRNPSLYPGVAEALGPSFAWHTHAASPRSSQALCVSAWVPLAGMDIRHAVVEALVRAAVPALSSPDPAARRWRIRLEVSDPDVLGERGGHAGSIDVLLEADDAVVAVESKFLRDAQDGFRGCGQFPASCRGFYGRGSDRAGSDAPCRLAVRDGRREARRYWEVAAGAFRDEALRPSAGEPGSCPLHRHFQLARTLLFARALAAPMPAAGPSEQRAGRRACARRDFAALVVAPGATAGLLSRLVNGFAATTLRPEQAGRVAVAHYEDLVRLLAESGDPRAAALAGFVSGLLPHASVPVGGRSPTARDLRRSAEAERRARRADARREDAPPRPRTMGS
jgi:hypothetical protein